MIYVLAACVAVIGIAVIVVVMTRRSAAATTPPEAPARPEEAPMTGLESALAQVKDRSGRTIGERIEAEHVDDLRIPDDTGPLLRRALDHVTPRNEAGATPVVPVVPAEPSETDDERSS